MSLFFMLALAGATYYLISVAIKNHKYKKLNPIDVVSLTNDNSSMRNICGVLLFLMLTLSGLALGSLFRENRFFSLESLKIALTLFFFIVLYIPLSAKTKVSNIGIYRNSTVISWSDIDKIELPTDNRIEKFKIKVTYKSKYTKHNVIELLCKRNKEYDDFLLLVEKYSKVKIGNKKKQRKEVKK
ncbi:hypothetical protein JYG23_08595 [Sedimentibacter sp. zth1]|uniref:hypothetical protein n=1 Tax=Sedimentibacter sp. zth1 TaxID=2816908 RepID=UPI001A915E25|nr:hypothetical protein [Sedimentibacter sp. zth1]QSX04765.1 hypothetical protein JYG23_08595 [Sedimentibacter sp. zth1]